MLIVAKRRKGKIITTVKGKKRRKFGEPMDLDLKKGALTNYVRNNWGDKGFTDRGTIKVSVLNDISNGKKTPKGTSPNQKTRKRATLAKNMRSWK